ncbi:glycosyltransferase family 2 protein [Herbaspirillum lusitanum]|jgi:glycosyltransferase involved in cell wall biosynthesis|uniref:Glycosyltransferase family 2 protein n=1 Tax=Herbaspirillum lusitanum TaxID=213312 RepID=A0ABW9ACW9_9BURK
MIGVVIPAHNEEQYLSACLSAMHLAARHPALNEAVRIIVALDACTDRSALIARSHQVEIIALQARNVGMARAAGASRLLAAGARWLAFTDADSLVAPDWLAAQLLLELNADAVCGTICVDDWSEHSPQLQEHFRTSYFDREGHRHIHGANFGISARAYKSVGGFPPMACSEDVAIVDLLIAAGARIAWSASPRVNTSARIASKARGGFGDTLSAWRPEDPATAPLA